MSNTTNNSPAFDFSRTHQYLSPEKEKRRWEILGLREPQKQYDVRTLAWISEEEAETLIAEGFLDEDDYQNDSPTVREMLDFMGEYPGVFALSGYVVTPYRPDTRISVDRIKLKEGISVYSLDMILDFYKFAKKPDDLYIELREMSAWWD